MIAKIDFFVFLLLHTLSTEPIGKERNIQVCTYLKPININIFTQFSKEKPIEKKLSIFQFSIAS